MSNKCELKEIRERLKAVPKQEKPVLTHRRQSLRQGFLDNLQDPERIRRAKYEMVFERFFDMNKNRVIDWNDFETLGERIKAFRGEDSQEYLIIRDTIPSIWKGVVEEVKGKGAFEGRLDEATVTAEEWVDLWERQDPKKKMPHWQWEYLKYMFFFIDTGGDKAINKMEYREAMKMHGMSGPQASDAFDRFAVDKDGNPVETIDYGDFVRLWNEYFSSGDRNAPGNYLFGF